MIKFPSSKASCDHNAMKQKLELNDIENFQVGRQGWHPSFWKTLSRSFYIAEHCFPEDSGEHTCMNMSGNLFFSFLPGNQQDVLVACLPVNCL